MMNDILRIIPLVIAVVGMVIGAACYIVAIAYYWTKFIVGFDLSIGMSCLASGSLLIPLSFLVAYMAPKVDL